MLRSYRKLNSGLCTAVLVALVPLVGCVEKETVVPPIKDNYPPTILAQSDTFAVVGDTIRLHFTASDVDGDPVRFEQEVLVSWSDVMAGRIPVSGIGPRTGDFWMWAQATDMPERYVIVSAHDDRGGSATANFHITVRDAAP
ncbi:MAG: hypothetical protein GY838_03105 [bacterium]|nr:hypothetical protein [bacterium]